VIGENRDPISGIAAAVEKQSVTTRETARNVALIAKGVRDMQDSLVTTSEGARTITADMQEVNASSDRVKQASARVSDQSHGLETIGAALREVVSRFRL